jgi:hypothetical protein
MGIGISTFDCIQIENPQMREWLNTENLFWAHEDSDRDKILAYRLLPLQVVGL